MAGTYAREMVSPDGTDEERPLFLVKWTAATHDTHTPLPPLPGIVRGGVRQPNRRPDDGLSTRADAEPIDAGEAETAVLHRVPPRVSAP